MVAVRPPPPLKALTTPVRATDRDGRRHLRAAAAALPSADLSTGLGSCEDHWHETLCQAYLPDSDRRLGPCEPCNLNAALRVPSAQHRTRIVIRFGRAYRRRVCRPAAAGAAARPPLPATRRADPRVRSRSPAPAAGGPPGPPGPTRTAPDSERGLVTRSRHDPCQWIMIPSRAFSEGTTRSPWRWQVYHLTVQVRVGLGGVSRGCRILGFTGRGPGRGPPEPPRPGHESLGRPVPSAADSLRRPLSHPWRP